jgi:molybdopterin-guanine dinucleotide biosynthesis protein A
MPPAALGDITGVVLAGGRGARMGGADKGLIELDGAPLVQHVLVRFAPQVAQVMISANRNLERYRTYAPRVFGDDAPAGDYAGPLAGLRAGLAHAATPWVAFVPCDAPRLPMTLVAQLADAVGTRGARAAVARCDGRVQPVFCLLATALLPALDAHRATGGAAVHRWLDAAGAIAVDFQDAGAFSNVNSPAALAAGLR